jgi:ATP-binding cassette subfamily C protein
LSEWNLFWRIAAKKYPGKISSLILIDIFGGGLTLVGFGGIASFIQLVFSNDPVSAKLPHPIDTFFPSFELTSINPISILIFSSLIMLFQVLINGLGKYIVALIAIGFRKDMRNELNDELSKIDWISFTSMDHGKYLNNLIAESTGAGNALRSSSATAADLIKILVFAIWMIVFSAETFVIFASIGFVSLIVAKPLLRLSRQMAEKRIALSKKMTNTINDTRFIFKIILVENLAKSRLSKISQLISKSAEIERLNHAYSIISSQYINLIPFLLVVSVSYYRLVVQNSDGASLAFDLLVLQQIGKHFGSFQSNRQKTINNIPSYEACIEMIEVFQPKQADKSGSQLISGIEVGIDVAKVTYRYPTGGLALNQTEVFLPPTGLVSIIGESGSGKTTLVDMILGLINPESGQLLFDNIDQEAIKPESLSSILAYLPQDVYLFQGTLRDNLTLGRRVANNSEIFEALRIADCDDVVKNLPNGLLEEVLPGGVNFSGGERHRFALARALIRKAKILVLDEPSSSVDRVSEQLIFQSLRKLSKDLLVIVISHSETIIQETDHIILMKDGRCDWQGNYTDYKVSKHFAT